MPDSAPTPSGFIEKIRILFLPFLAISTAFLLSYSFLHWLLLIRMQLLRLQEETVNLWIPMILAWMLVYSFLRRRINLLHFKRNNFGYHAFAAIALMAPVIIGQFY